MPSTPITSQYQEAILHAKKHGYTPKKRAFSAPRILIGDRDLKILSALHRFRLMSPEQVSRWFFPKDARGESSRERLAELYSNGYIERIERPRDSRKPQLGYVYRLASRGGATLAELAGTPFSEFQYWGRLADRKLRSNLATINHVQHALEVTDLRMAMEEAAGKARCRIERWLDHYDLMPSWKTERVPIRYESGKEEETAVTPDGYFVLNTPQGRGHFFLEIDTGSESIHHKWQKKILTYKQYLASGLFHRTYQVPASVSFRVLAITRGIPRATNLRVAAEKYGSPDAARAFLAAPRTAMGNLILTDRIWLRGGFSDAQALLS